MTLESASLKLDWAMQHIENLETEIHEFFEGENFRFVVEYDETFFREGGKLPDGTQLPDSVGTWNVTLVVESQPPVNRWSLMIGDVISALRSVLDHSVYALSLSFSQSASAFELIERQLQFPIFDTKANFDKNAPRWLSGIPSHAVIDIEGFQPYCAPQGSLGTLQSLSNADKHRSVRLAIAYLDRITIYDANSIHEPPPAVTLHYSSEVGPRIIHDLVSGLNIGQTSFGDTEANRAADFRTIPAFEVLFGEGEVATHRNVSEVLREIYDEVQTVHTILKGHVAKN